MWMRLIGLGGMITWAFARKFALAVVALGLAVAGHTGEPTRAPILRIEAGAHVMPISFVDLDRVRNRAITVAFDKTVRIWQLPELRLIQTLRVPIEAGNEGALFAASVSPDGRRVAVGGWTGLQWNGTASVYIFDIETGTMIRRVGGFPRLISALAYTPDSRHLLVGLQSDGGLRILDAASFREVARDPEYRGNVTDISVANPGGWIVTTALDGALRVYDATHHLLQRQPLGISRRPGNTAVSADGQRFALGFSDLPVVAVFRLPDLHLQFAARIEDEPGQKGLCCVAWAADGSLLATGEHADDRALVFRWSQEGKSTGPPLDLGRHRAGGKMLLDDGSLLLTTDEPRLAIVSREGQVLHELGSPALDLSRIGDGLLLSPDAGRVAWRHPDGYVQAMDLIRQGLFDLPTAPGVAIRTVRACGGGKEGGRVSVCGASRRGLQDAAEQKTYVENPEPAAPPPDLLSTPWSGPRRHVAGRSIDCGDAEHPVLDGRPVVLDALERCTAWSYSADGETLVLGTNWSLRRYNREGQALWRVYTQGQVHAVNLSANGRYLVAALADGTLRWFDPKSGQEQFGLFLHSNELDWVFWRPDGYYAASPEGDQFVGWHINDGQDKEARFYRAVQFERLFYRPDLVRASLDPSQPTASGGAVAGIENIAAIEPPTIRIREAASPGGRPGITINVDGLGTPIIDYRVYLNGIPILNPAERTLNKDERLHFTRNIDFNATGKGDHLRVEAFNGRSMGLAEYYFRSPIARPTPRQAGDLYVLAVGVNRFDRIPPGPDRILDDLEFAAQDANAFARLMEGTQGHPYKNLHVTVVSDQGTLPTRQAVVEALPVLQQAGADDTVVLFLASHGFSDPAGNYFFVPRDATQRDIQDALAGRFVDREPASLVSWRTLFDAMRDSAGRRLLIVDTCQSLAVAGSFDTRSLKKRTAASRFAMMTASQRDEFSQEYAEGGHGLFTFALLEALKRPVGAAARRVTVEDAYEHTSRVVKELGDASTRQTPQLIAPAFLADSAMVSW